MATVPNQKTVIPPPEKSKVMAKCTSILFIVCIVLSFRHGVGFSLKHIWDREKNSLLQNVYCVFYNNICEWWFLKQGK